MSVEMLTDAEVQRLIENELQRRRVEAELAPAWRLREDSRMTKPALRRELQRDPARGRLLVLIRAARAMVLDGDNATPLWWRMTERPEEAGQLFARELRWLARVVTAGQEEGGGWRSALDPRMSFWKARDRLELALAVMDEFGIEVEEAA